MSNPLVETHVKNADSETTACGIDMAPISSTTYFYVTLECYLEFWVGKDHKGLCPDCEAVVAA